MAASPSRETAASPRLAARAIAWFGWLILVLGMPARAQEPHVGEAEAYRQATAEVRFGADVIAFYAGRDYAPLWTAASGLSEAGRELEQAVDAVDEDGLEPERYRLPPWAGNDSRAEAEAAWSAAFLRLAHDLTQGRVDPAHVHADWHAAPRAWDGVALLTRAARRGPLDALAAARPAHGAYERLRAALAHYRGLASAGAWPSLPPGPVLRPGDVSDIVPRLRDRLRASGDLGDTAFPVVPERYDLVLAEAVRQFQARHGLEVDAVVGPATRAALDVSAAERARTIALNMERWRWMPESLGGTHLHVNAASMTLEYVEGGRVAFAARVVVGTPKDPTPGFSSTVTHAVLSPYWNVPERIAREEVRPAAARDPGYYARHEMRVLPGGQIRQEPGPRNPLGPVKFIFDNPFGVRLHGTSEPWLFGATTRAFSHGCIRVEEPLRLAERLLVGTDWDADRIAAAVEARKERWVRLPAAVPIHVAYWTAWVDDAGVVHFRDDLYGRDVALSRALREAEGVTSADQRSRSGGTSTMVPGAALEGISTTYQRSPTCTL